MTRKEAVRINYQENRLVALGFTHPEAEALEDLRAALGRP